MASIALQIWDSSSRFQGYLLLADLSGYTAYVAGVELDHARNVLSELLELVVGRLTSVMTLARLEGDAVFAYLPTARLSRAETFLELLDATYVAFRDRVEGIRRRNTCDCRACRAIPDLDLKFIVHVGEYVVQDIAGTHELLGSDVNLVHRLAKNGVAEATGWRGYVLFTEAALAHVGLAPAGLHEQLEAYEHLGETCTYSLDLRARYRAIAEARRVVIEPGAAHLTYTADLPAEPAAVWEWLNDPQKRSLWMPGMSWRAGLRPGGRTGPGARNHCTHGKGEALETILDWRPFDYYTSETRPSPSSKMFALETYRLEPTPRGTRLWQHVQVKTPLPASLARLLAPLFARMARLPMYHSLLVRAVTAHESEPPTETPPP